MLAGAWHVNKEARSPPWECLCPQHPPGCFWGPDWPFPAPVQGKVQRALKGPLRPAASAACLCEAHEGRGLTAPSWPEGLLRTEPLRRRGHWKLPERLPLPQPDCPHTHSPKAAPTKAKQERSQRKAMLLQAGKCEVPTVSAPFISPGIPQTPPTPPALPSQRGQRATLPVIQGPWVISGGQAPLAARPGSQPGTPSP